MVRPQSRGVKDDIEVSRGDSTLTDRLADKEEVVPAVAEREEITQTYKKNDVRDCVMCSENHQLCVILRPCAASSLTIL